MDENRKSRPEMKPKLGVLALPPACTKGENPDGIQIDSTSWHWHSLQHRMLAQQIRRDSSEKAPHE